MAKKDYLKKFIEDSTGGTGENDNIFNGDDGDGGNSNSFEKLNSSNKDREYISVDINTLPLGVFYKEGTLIKIRAARVEEVQSYSIVDNNNFVDITEKMNQLLSSCVRFYHPDMSMGSYKDLKDGDRMFIIFQIRELTFQTGPALSKEVECDSCRHEFPIIYRTTSNSQYPKTLVNHSFPEKMKKYFNKSLKCFELNINGVKYKLAPPTIGIQESFFTDIRKKVEENQKKNPNVSQMKLLQFLLWDKTYITSEGIKSKEDEIKKFNMETFQILNSAVDKMEFGLKELNQKCPNCGSEVHSEVTFPDGAAGLFVIPNFFDEFDGE